MPDNLSDRERGQEGKKESEWMDGPVKIKLYT